MSGGLDSYSFLDQGVVETEIRGHLIPLLRRVYPVVAKTCLVLARSGGLL
jgi:hypothetical protein